MQPSAKTVDFEKYSESTWTQYFPINDNTENVFQLDL